MRSEKREVRSEKSEVRSQKSRMNRNITHTPTLMGVQNRFLGNRFFQNIFCGRCAFDQNGPCAQNLASTRRTRSSGAAAPTVPVRSAVLCKGRQEPHSSATIIIRSLGPIAPIPLLLLPHRSATITRRSRALRQAKTAPPTRSPITWLPPTTKRRV